MLLMVLLIQLHWIVHFPKNTKLKVLKNVSQRSMKTFYKLADKHIMNKHGVLSQTNNYKFSEKKNSAFKKR